MKLSEIASLIKLTSFDIEKIEAEECGRVISVSDGIIVIFGLESAFINEIVHFESGTKGIVMSIDPETITVIAFKNYCEIKEGDIVRRTKETCKGPYGEGVLGRIFNGLGEPIDGLGPIVNIEYRGVESQAPGVIDRKSVDQPFYTGLLSIDSCLAIGKGQRELIIGDRQTGKTSIAINMILNQLSQKEKMYCIYVGIGQKISNIANIAKILKESGAMEFSTIVSASASDAPIEQFLAPYFGCLMGEYFRDNGKNALIIYDDLSKQAVAYREISLLLRRPPGREAYPGDVFYIHSRLLERAGRVKYNGGGSLTAIPIIETQKGDVSGYVSTNVISITDGQIFLDKNDFNSGKMPPIDLRLSVSRIGSAAQNPIVKYLSSGIKSEVAQYYELKEFMKFSSTIDDDNSRILLKGSILEKILQQNFVMNFTQIVVTLLSHKENIFLNLFKILEKENIKEPDCHEFISEFIKKYDINLDNISKDDFLNLTQQNIKLKMNEFIKLYTEILKKQ